ncbi:50S ribosomal protein L24 [bacterium HR37]|nr:50S ribosomal protein L24 [bacterium HR37]
MEVIQKKFHIKKGDTVYVIAGKEKGKTGKVLRILRDKNKAIVERLNIVKRHMRPSPKNPAGGIVEKEAGIHISNLMLYCPKCSRPTRVGRKRLGSGEKVRYCKRCGEEIKN